MQVPGVRSKGEGINIVMRVSREWRGKVPVMKDACCRKLESLAPSTQASTGMEDRCAEKMQFIMAL